MPESGLGRAVAGSADSVEQLTRQDLIYFLHSSYTPEQMIVSAAGNLNHEDFVAQVRDSFWRLMGSRPAPASVKPRFQRCVHLETSNSNQAYIAIGLEAFPYTHPDRYALHVLNQLLGGGISSRIFKRLREELALVYSCQTEYHAYRDGGMITCEASTTPVNLIPVLQQTLLELKSLAGGEVSICDEELQRAKIQVRARHLLGSESSHTRMSRLATQELYFDRNLSEDEVLASIEAVDLDHLERLAKKVLGGGLAKPAVILVAPDKPEYYDLETLEAVVSEIVGPPHSTSEGSALQSPDPNRTDPEIRSNQ